MSDDLLDEATRRAGDYADYHHDYGMARVLNELIQRVRQAEAERQLGPSGMRRGASSTRCASGPTTTSEAHRTPHCSPSSTTNRPHNPRTPTRGPATPAGPHACPRKAHMSSEDWQGFRCVCGEFVTQLHAECRSLLTSDDLDKLERAR